MPFGNEVPYHYREYADGRYVIEEHATVASVIRAMDFFRLQNCVENELLWGKPGRGVSGNVEDPDFVRPFVNLKRFTIPFLLAVLLWLIIIAIALRFS